MKKFISVLLIGGMVLSLCSGCYDAKEIDSMTYLIALGVDKGNTDVYRFTFEFAKPNDGSSSEGGEGKEEQSDIVVIEAPTFFAAESKIKDFKSKEVNIEHIKVIVFSEELAREGIKDLINGFIRPAQMRHNAFIAVAKGSAGEFISEAKPIYEVFISRYYEYLFDKRHKQTSLETLLYKFYFDMHANDQDPLMPLVSLAGYKEKEELDNARSTEGKTDDFTNHYTAGELPRFSANKTETLGAAVFRNDKMVATLTDIDATIYYILTGVYQKSYFTMLDPNSQSDYIDILLSQDKKPTIKTELHENTLMVSIDIPLKGEFTAIESKYPYLNDPNAFTDAFNQRMEEMTVTLLNKAAKEWQADIFGWGERAKSKFFTLQAWEAFDWRKHYPNTQFTVKYHLEMSRSGEYKTSAQEEDKW